MTTNPSDPHGGPTASPAPETTGTYQAPPQAGPRPASAAATPPAPPAPMKPEDEKTWAILTHLSPLLGFFTGVLFVAPIILYFVFKDRGPFIRHHVTESLNAIISLGIYSVALTVAATLFTVVTLGIGAFAYGLLGILAAYGLLGILAVIAAVFWIIAAVEANKGRWYRYPLVIRFVR